MIKRAAALLSAMMIMMCCSGVLCFAAEADESKDAGAASQTQTQTQSTDASATDEESAGTPGALKLEKTSPKDGAKGTSVDNLSVKLEFSEDVYNKDRQDANRKCIKMVSDSGDEVPLLIVFNAKNKKEVLAVGDTTSKDSYKIEQDTTYKLTVSADFESTAGNTLGTDQTMEFRTNNQKRTMFVNMAMMAVMMGGIMVVTMRSAKKEMDKSKDDKKAVVEKKVNPYKVAKETGKSVEEVIAETAKDNQKRIAKAEKEAEKEAKYEAKIEAHLEKKAGKKKGKANKVTVQGLTERGTRRVSAPKPISAGGSTYKTGRKAEAEERARKEAEQKAKGTTNPKNKKGKKGKKKKK